MNCAKNAKEARKIAKDRLSSSDSFLTDLNYCALDETPFKHSLTEEWKTKMKIHYVIFYELLSYSDNYWFFPKYFASIIGMSHNITWLISPQHFTLKTKTVPYCTIM